MTRRIELAAEEVRPAIDEVLKYLESGALDELVVMRGERVVARMTAARGDAPHAGSGAARPAHDRRADPDRARRSSGAGGLGRFLATLLMLAVLAGVAAFFAAPAYAFFALRSAAQAQDVQGLAQLVDFTAVRASLRPQLSADPRAMAPPPSLMEDPIGAIRHRLEQTQAPDASAYLTPEAIAGLTYGEGRYASERSRTGQAIQPVPGGLGEPWPRPRHWGVNRVRLAVVDAGGSETTFTFERRGVFTWMLAHIGLPDGAAPAFVPAEPATPEAG